MDRTLIEKTRNSSILLFIAAGCFLIGSIFLTVISGFNFTWMIAVDYVNFIYESFSFGLIQAAVSFFALGLFFYGLSSISLGRGFRVTKVGNNDLLSEISNFSTYSIAAGVASIITALVVFFPLVIAIIAYVVSFYLVLAPIVSLGLHIVMHFRINFILQRMSKSFIGYEKLDSRNFTNSGLLNLLGIIGFAVLPIVGGLSYVFMFILNGVQLRRTSKLLDRYYDVLVQDEQSVIKTEPEIAKKLQTTELVLENLTETKVDDSARFFFCSNCGKKLDVNVKFCGRCGKLVE